MTVRPNEPDQKSSLALNINGNNYRIQAIVFDLDGTLYPRRKVVYGMLRRLFPRMLRLKRYDAFRRDARGRDYGSGAALMQAALDAYSPDMAKQARYRDWLETVYFPTLVSAVSRATLREGLNELLAGLQRRGVKLAVVSDYGYVEERLAGLGCPPGGFDLLLGTETIGVMKPHPRISEIICDTLRTSPEHILVVGDRADTDKALAQESGMAFLGISDKAPDHNAPEWMCWEDARTLLGSALI